MGRLTHRLEAASAAIVHRARQIREEQEALAAGDNQVAIAQRQLLVYPSSLAFPVRPDSTDDELTALLEVSPMVESTPCSDSSLTR